MDRLDLLDALVTRLTSGRDREALASTAPRVRAAMAQTVLPGTVHDMLRVRDWRRIGDAVAEIDVDLIWYVLTATAWDPMPQFTHPAATLEEVRDLRTRSRARVGALAQVLVASPVFLDYAMRLLSRRLEVCFIDNPHDAGSAPSLRPRPRAMHELTTWPSINGSSRQASRRRWRWRAALQRDPAFRQRAITVFGPLLVWALQEADRRGEPFDIHNRRRPAWSLLDSGTWQNWDVTALPAVYQRLQDRLRRPPHDHAWVTRMVAIGLLVRQVLLMVQQSNLLRVHEMRAQEQRLLGETPQTVETSNSLRLLRENMRSVQLASEDIERQLRFPTDQVREFHGNTSPPQNGQ